MGLDTLLKSTEDFKFLVISAENDTAIYREDYIRTFLDSCFEKKLEDVDVYVLGFVLKKEEIKELYLDQVSFWNDPVELIKFVEKEKELMKEKRILVIDSLSLLSIQASSNSNYGSLSNLIKLLEQRFKKIAGFMEPDTMESRDSRFIITHSDSVGHLSSNARYGNTFFCNSLKMKPSGKIISESSTFEVKDGKIISSEIKYEKKKGEEDSKRELLSSLTTFKLTLEDNEKEAKSQLYLPYFEAQKTKLEIPDNDELEDFDDEDEDD